MQITIDKVREDGVFKYYVLCEYADGYKVFTDSIDVVCYVNACL